MKTGAIIVETGGAAQTQGQDYRWVRVGLFGRMREKRKQLRGVSSRVYSFGLSLQPAAQRRVLVLQGLLTHAITGLIHLSRCGSIGLAQSGAG